MRKSDRVVSRVAGEDIQWEAGDGWRVWDGGVRRRVPQMPVTQLHVMT